MTSQQICQYLTFNMKNSYTAVNIAYKIVKKKRKHMAVIHTRPTHILYQCAKCGDDHTSFDVIYDVCDV